ncbi:MAG: CsbD family protein [Desulfuromonadales bacterium]|nr:CsbD family protein [Desulfuromonadales bacterium]
MNKDELKGKWMQLKGSIKSRWGKLTDDDIQRIEGDRDKLVGKVQEKYGKSREEAEKQVDEFTTRH